MQRLVLSGLATVALLLVPSDRVSAGLWEKFWAKKHTYHNSLRGVKHNHYHHHKYGHKAGPHKSGSHKSGHCGTSACKSCAGGSHAYAAPVYPPTGYQYPAYQPQAYQPPAYQPPVCHGPAYQPPVYQPPVQQTYVAPPVVPQPVPLPVATPTVSWQNVSRLEYRLQPQTQTIPVTRHRTVTVDEGSWQKIWVPKVVAKQVPETVYQQQTVYQQVPYQVTQQVPQVSYVSRQMAVARPAPCQAVYPRANWLGFGCPPPMAASSPLPVPYSLQRSTLSPLVLPPLGVRAPVTLGREIEPLENTAPGQFQQRVPEPRADYGGLTPVQAADSNATPARAASTNGMFVPAPSAASIWRARQGTRLR